MSLRITIELVKDREGLVVKDEFGQEDLDPVTRMLGVAMMDVAMGSVEEGTKTELLRRINLVERLKGAYLHNGEGERFFTMSDLNRRIGMYTNVITATSKKFAQDIQKAIEEGRL